MPNPENLKSFKKGHDPKRNLKGRPLKLPELDILCAEVLGETKKDVSAAKAILRAMLKKAIKGDVRAATLMLDRGYGKVIQQIDHTTKGNRVDVPMTDAQMVAILNKIREKKNEH